MKLSFGTFILLSIFSLQLAFAQVQTGKASFYADKFEGRTTASGEKYKHSKLTAAHKTLPFGTKVKVTNLANGRSVEVVINDRGPYVEGRIIDLSKSGAKALGFINQGLADVKIEILDAGDGKGKSMGVPRSGEQDPEEVAYYKLEVEDFKPKGFGVQLGTFKDQANLIKFTGDLKLKVSTIVEVKNIKGQRVYALIAAPFKSYAKAQEYKKDIAQEFPDSFVVDFSK